MKIAICSDIHLEFGDLYIENTERADVLILSGDIMIAEDMHDHKETNPEITTLLKKIGARQAAAQVYRNFLKNVSEQYEHVVYVAGNHEFYHGRWVASIEHLREECAAFNNVHFLECDTWNYNDYCFVGGTLWTDLNRADPVTMYTVQTGMNDYDCIKNDDAGFTKLRAAHTLLRHRATVDYIRNVLDSNVTKKCIVVGHHAPCTQSIDERYRNDHHLNGAYVSDLSNFILDRPQIKLWTHGHTHVNFDYMLGSTRIVCNPRGYVGYERDTQEHDPYVPYIVEV